MDLARIARGAFYHQCGRDGRRRVHLACATALVAVVSTQLVAAFTRTPYIKPPDLTREWTAMPRSLVNFDILNGVLAAKPVNDQQELIISFALPTEFAYRMLSLVVSLIQDVAHDWRNRSYLEVTNGIRGLQIGATSRYAMSNESLDRIPTISEMFLARFQRAPPGDVFQARDGVAPVITFKASNQTAAVGAAGTVNCLATFLEYDIEQAQRFPIHWPALIYNR